MFQINYSEIFQSLMRDRKVTEMMGDFLIQTMDHCSEFREKVIEKVLESDDISSLIENKILELSKKNSIKSKIYEKMENWLCMI